MGAFEHFVNQYQRGVSTCGSLAGGGTSGQSGDRTCLIVAREVPIPGVE